MPDSEQVETAVHGIAEHLADVFDLPEWTVVRQGRESSDAWSGPLLRSEKYVGRDGSTPEDFSREVTAAFASVGAEEEPAERDGGWLIGRARLADARIIVRSKGAIEIEVN